MASIVLWKEALAHEGLYDMQELLRQHGEPNSLYGNSEQL
jgi:hypothetical protein